MEEMGGGSSRGCWIGLGEQGLNHQVKPIAEAQLKPVAVRLAPPAGEIGGVEGDTLGGGEDEQHRALVLRERLDPLEAGVEAAVEEVAGQVDHDLHLATDHALQTGEDPGEPDRSQERLAV